MFLVMSSLVFSCLPRLAPELASMRCNFGPGPARPFVLYFLSQLLILWRCCCSASSSFPFQHPPFSGQDMTHAPFKCWSIAELGLLLCFASFPSPQRGHFLGPSCCDSARAHASTKISDAQTG
ncbi:hypothetical protein V8C43DRAFT_276979 [Trichoderma afarasin]